MAVVAKPIVLFFVFCTLYFVLRYLVPPGSSKNQVQRTKHYVLIVKYPLTAITLSAVGKNCDHAFPWAQAFGNLVCRGGSGAGRPASKKTFKPRDLFQRRADFVVLDHHDLIREGTIEDLRNKVALSDAFNLLWSRRVAAVNRTFRLDEDAEYVRVVLPHRTCDAAERSRCPGSDHDRVNRGVYLFNDLACRRQFMKARVSIILKLLRHKAAVDGVRKFVATVDSALHAGFV